MDFTSFHKLSDWQNHHVTHINRMPAHAPWNAYESEEAAKAAEGKSKFLYSLDGIWKFRLFKSPNAVPEEFKDSIMFCDDWEEIAVPGCWQTQGFSKPVYTNFRYTFDMESPGTPKRKPYLKKENHLTHMYAPPYVPEQNPAGCYIREFEVPEYVSEKNVFIRFGGVETAFYLWVNGIAVGYSQDSKVPVEFDITGFIHQGVNTVAVMVLQYCDGTYLEDQDYWHLNGIFRSVHVIAKPGVRIKDYVIDARMNGELSAMVYTNDADGYADHKICMKVFDPDGKLVESQISDINPGPTVHDVMLDSRNSNPYDAAEFSFNLEEPTLWSPEKPALYTGTFTLIAPDGRETDFESVKIGFRTIDISDGNVRLNGVPLVFRGVNRHEHSLEGGRFVSEEYMTAEIVQMKRLNFNAARSSHYPNSQKWYDLCDKYGMLIICEANIETHGICGRLSADYSWAGAYLERCINMVTTFRHHPCIYSWSLGNESSLGASHAAMAGWVRFADKSRIVQYEGGNPNKQISDIICPIYTRDSEIIDMLTSCTDDRPVILVEYACQLTNSGGNFNEYWQLVEKYKRFQGGYIWDWCDKALQILDENGHCKGWGYGGDFGEEIVDMPSPYMCAYGVVLPNLEPKPAAYEIKNCQSPVKITEYDVKTGMTHVKNYFSDTDLSEFLLEYEVIEDGIRIVSGKSDLPCCPPLGSVQTAIDYEHSPKAGCEYYLNFYIKTTEKSEWADEGHEIYRTQFPLAKAPAQKSTRTAAADIEIKKESVGFSAESETVKTIVGKNGEITIYDRMGQPLIWGIRPCFYRPPTGIDFGWGLGIEGDWKQAGYDKLKETFTASEVRKNEEGNAEIIIKKMLEMKTGLCIKYTMAISVKPNSISFDIEADIPIGSCHLPRVGIELTLRGNYKKIEWYGRGPWENYCDRKSSALFGLYSDLVDETFVPFLPPCECGGFEDVKYLKLINEEEGEIIIESADRFHFDAHNYTIEDCIKAGHDFELKKSENTIVHIDCAYAGMGGDDGWSKPLKEKYRVASGRYKYHCDVLVK